MTCTPTRPPSRSLASDSVTVARRSGPPKFVVRCAGGSSSDTERVAQVVGESRAWPHREGFVPVQIHTPNVLRGLQERQREVAGVRQEDELRHNEDTTQQHFHPHAASEELRSAVARCRRVD